MVLADEDTGWTVGNRETVGRTNDGGMTWTTQTFEWPGSSHAYRRVVAADSNRVWLFGDDRTTPIAHTSDGGETWALQANGLTSEDLYGATLFHPLSPTSTWNADASANWNTPSNWSLTVVPHSNTADVVFGDSITAPRTVTTDIPVTAKSVRLDSPISYVIAGFGSINLKADEGDASIDVVRGHHQFQASVNLISNTDATIESGAALTFNNALNLNGKTLTMNGGGTMAINNLLTIGGGSLVVLDGTVSGHGTVGGDLTNESGTISPGNSSAVLSVPEPSTLALAVWYGQLQWYGPFGRFHRSQRLDSLPPRQRSVPQHQLRRQ